MSAHASRDDGGDGRRPQRGPRGLRALAALLLPRDDRDVIVGDLEELFVLRERRQGRARATLMYLRDSVGSVAARRLRRAPQPPDPKRLGSSRRSSLLSSLATDLRLALRSLRLRPGFSALVVLTLALGIGATTAVFRLIDQLLLSPLPGIRDPDGAAYVQLAPGGISALDFLDLRREAASTEGLAASGLLLEQLRLAAEERPLQVRSSWIHGDYFELLGVRPARGRLLSAEETGYDSDANVAVISERLWRTRLGAAEDVIGRTVSVSGKPVTIVGVAGGGFMGAERGFPIDMWRPLSASSTAAERILARETTNHGGSTPLLVRPRAGVSFEDVEADLTRAIARMAQTNEVSREVLARAKAVVYPSLSTRPIARAATTRVLRILSVVAALVLLLACANVANLLLFRGVERRGVTAIRRAMGATAASIVRQELVGSLVLSFLGTALGVGFAWAIGLGFRGERLLFGPDQLDGLTLDARIFAFALLIMVSTTLLAGVLPAALLGRTQLGDSAKTPGKGTSRRQAGLRSALCMVQIALCIPLVVGARLLLRTVDNLYAVDLGMEPEGVIASQLEPDVGLYPDEVQLHLVDAAAAVPGVQSAALESPGVFTHVLHVDEVRLPSQTPAEALDVTVNYVTAGWFDVLRIEPQLGRGFAPDDLAPGAPPTVIVTSRLAKRLFPEGDILGRLVVVGRARRGSTSVEAEIVGVLGDTYIDGPGGQPAETVMLPYTQRLSRGGVSSLLVRPRDANERLSKDVQTTLAASLPDLPLPAEPIPLISRIDDQISVQRLLARLLGLVSVLAVVLAGVGIYGVISFAVASRKREVGIRLALGSSMSRIAALVMRQATVILLVGVVVGLWGAQALSRLLESRLFEVAGSDPEAYASSVIVLVAVTLLACVVPMRSAMRVDPAGMLREE